MKKDGTNTLDNFWCSKRFDQQYCRIRKALEDSVHRQLMSDVPYGSCFQGSRSSIISAIARKFSAMRIESQDLKEAWCRVFILSLWVLKVHRSGCCTESCRSHWHSSPRSGIFNSGGLVPYLMWSTPWDIRCDDGSGINTDVSSCQSNKSWGWKWYFRVKGRWNIRRLSIFSQSARCKSFHEETVRKLNKLHLYDCLRANKSLAAWGIEGRVPFWQEFLEVACN